MKNIWRLFSLVPKYKSRLFKVLLINSGLGLVGLITPYVYRDILNLVVTSVREGATAAIYHEIELAFVALLIFGALGSLFDYIAERLGDLLFIDLLSDIRRHVFSHLANLSIDYYEQTRSGEILERVNTGTVDFAQWASNLSDGLLGNFLTILFIAIYMWIKFPIIGLIMTVSLVLNFYWAIIKIVRTKPIRRQFRKQAEGATGQMTETVTHIATVRSFAQEKYKLTRYLEWLDEFRSLRIKAFKIEWATNLYRGLLNAMTVAAVIGLVALGVFHGYYTVGDILLVSLYLNQMQGNIGPLSRLIINSGDVETEAERISELLDVKPTVVDASNAVPLTELESIEFQQVSFAYPGKETNVLHDISFKLEKGQTLALVGPSGVGKTTVTKLLMRFYAPTSGQILFNGQPIETFTQNSIRSVVGTVMQDVALFNDTVEENLRFARPGASEEEIQAAAKVAHADTFIGKLPDGYKTLVGERGIKLSGGEKQRVAIARAILRDPQLIILDEATSSLDSESERFVQDGLEKLMKNRTAVVIAHRLSTVRKADQILVLENGTIAERGTHEDLVKNKQLYAKLLAIQTAGALS